MMSKAEKKARPRGTLHVTLGSIETKLADQVQARELWLERERLELRSLRSRYAALHIDLEAERERYAELFDFAPIGYLTLDGAGIIQSANLAAAQLLDAQRVRLIGMPLLTKVVTGDRRRLLDHLRHCRTSFGPSTLDLEIARRDGHTTPAQLLSRRGSVGTTILSALVDMTDREQALAERRRLESAHQRAEHARELARAESAAKDRFIAVLSHELRNPLSPILFTVELLERRAVPPERLDGALALIRRNLDLEVRLIDDLLDVSRIAHGKLTLERQIVDLHDAIRDVVDGATTDLRRGELSLATELSASRHRVDADPARLRQVVWNLVINAIRNTPPGGRIMVRTLDVDDCVALRVSDTGRGVASHRLETIFQPFDQVDPPGRRRGGLGLGLAICRGIVEAHGGQVSAASDGPDRGATFTVVLPTASEVQRDAPREVDVTLPARRLRVLVVEDDVDSADAMGTVLTLRGHEVVVAHSVAEGLAYGRKAFDVLVSDIGLPDGTGTELMATLRQRGDLRGIAISGFGTPEDVRHSLEAGFERHMTKPVHLDELIEVIETMAR
jgi:PAS domain S-box-containing protein